MGTPDKEPLTKEHLAATALNEQGFLLSQVIREKIQGRMAGDTQNIWKYVASECPVTAVDGFQTRIDLVFASNDRHVCIECKRPHPMYKKWIFFDKDIPADPAATGRLAFETYQMPRWSPVEKNEGRHAIEPRNCRPPCSVFGSYLEVAMKKDGNNGWKASHTEAIEDSFRQVLRGHTGLMEKLMSREGCSHLYSIPVVVTTAELFDAYFDIQKVSLSTGMVDPKDLKLTPIEFCAVNYHADDSLALNSEGVCVRRSDIQPYLCGAQTRSVFVVHTEAINRFLVWLHESFFCG